MQEQIVKYAVIALPYIQKYRYVLIGGAVVGLFVFTVFRIDSTLQTEINEDKLNTAITEIQKVEIDEEAVKNIRDLEDRNASIDPNLPDNRANPFN